MKDKYRYSTSQLFNFAQDSYLERTSRPIYAVIFLLPFIVLYELGTILINTDVLNQTQIRIVAFVWLQNFLEYIGSGSRLAWVAPPLVVLVILISLQVASRKRWWFSLGDFLPMAIECILLAAPLIVLSLFLNSPAQIPSGNDQIATQAVQIRPEAVSDSLLLANSTPISDMKSSLMANIVTGIGAGIYEELVFRLILICLLMVLFQDVLGFTHKNAIVLSVLLSAAFFSAHHHIALVNGQLDQGSPFSWTEFGFRTIAGIYFAIVFAIRGFGITAGTHAFYDIIATIINAVFFQR
jgi:hypothetical protein